MNIKSNIERLRKLMKQNGIDAYIISDVDPHQSEYVAEYFKMTQEETKDYIRELHQDPALINHLVIRENSKLVGHSYALPNYLKPWIIATFYLAASTKDYLTQLLAKTISDCIERANCKYLLIDVIGDLHKFHPLYTKLGFENMASWAISAKLIK